MNQFIFMVLMVVGIAVGFGLLFSVPVMLLWNGCLVPAIPAIAEIGLLQAWGIMILCSLLFKSTSATTKS